MHGIKQTIRRLAIAAALGATVATGAAGTARAVGWSPATIVETSPVGRVAEAGEASTYLYEGRTRVNLPEDVVAEINAWSAAYLERLDEWSAEDGHGRDEFYGGMEEGFAYGVQTVMGRLGYLDEFSAEASDMEPGSTLADVPEGWDEANAGRTFLQWEDAAFGRID